MRRQAALVAKLISKLMFHSFALSLHYQMRRQAALVAKLISKAYVSLVCIVIAT